MTPAEATPADLLALPVEALLDAVAARSTAPGGGPVSAVVTALAGALTGMSARFSEAAAPAARADELRQDAAALARADIEAYGAYVAVRRSGADAAAVAAAMDEAIRIPLELARTAAAVAGLAAQLARDGNPRLRGDAAAAVLLAAAAARAAAVLVSENCGPPAGSAPDPRLVAAADAARSAGAAEQALLAGYPALLAGYPAVGRSSSG